MHPPRQVSCQGRGGGGVKGAKSREMYGPIELRGTRPEHFDTSLSSAVIGGSCSQMSTYSGGSESGLPLWGSQKRFKVPFLEDLTEGTMSLVISPDDLTVSTLERTSLPAQDRERDAVGYIDLLSSLPHAEDTHDVTQGSVDDQMQDSEIVLTQALMGQPDQKNTLELTNYAILLHTYHNETKKAAILLEEALKGEPTCLEALNFYGNLLHDVAEKARLTKEPTAIAQRDSIFDSGVHWLGHKSLRPNCYDYLVQSQKRLKPLAMSGMKSLGRRLLKLESAARKAGMQATGRLKIRT